MIEIEDLTFGYSRKKILFEDLNLSLKPGHIYGLLGKNGAGKSTLIKNITGLAFPKKGSCRINGVDTSLRLPETLGRIFLIPEEIYLPAVPVKVFVKNTAVFYANFNHAQFHHYLTEFDLDKEIVISSLSFGQQKKVMIAFALAANTEVLIMDEPTNGLDIPSKVQFRKIIAGSLSVERCIIISTHQVRDLDNLIDTLIVIHERKIVLNSTVDDIADKVLFTTLSSIDNQNVIYFETSVNGYDVIIPNQSARSSKVNLELLFNALISNNSEIVIKLKQTVHV